MGFFSRIFGPDPLAVETLQRLSRLDRKVSTLVANQQKITVQAEELKGYLATLATGVTVLTSTVDNLRVQLEQVKADAAVDTTELEAAVDGVGEIAAKLQSAINPGEDTPVIEPPEDGTPVVEPEVPGVVDEPTDPSSDAEGDTTPGDTPEPGATN